jgi:putative ABC transport system substrate-binding protein
MGSLAAVWPFSARGQSIKKIPKVGVLWHAGSAEQEAPYFGSLLEGFKNPGYVDGLNIKFEHRFPNEIPERFKSMGAELVSLEIDVLVVVGNNAAPYATNFTTTIPVVFILVGDPIGLKLVTSLARPGGNKTGLANFTAELIPKRHACGWRRHGRYGWYGLLSPTVQRSKALCNKSFNCSYSGQDLLRTAQHAQAAF